ncbi:MULTISPECIES: hypothetical protein [unclassified Streptomyces]|uniref:hypothetical protein n=1 Tax=unclassified Streptomyces TaxID=2593676 RepID=UPI004040FCEB
MAIVAVTAALGSVSACGTGGSGSASATGRHTPPAQAPIAVSPIAYLVKAEDATAKEHSAKVDGITTVGTLRQTHMSGDMDWASGAQGNFTMVIKSSVPTPIPTSRVKLRSDAMYMSTPPKYVTLLGGKHWTKTPFALLAAQGAAGKAQADMMQQANPTLSVRMLISSGDVHKVGQENVRGVPATHYSGTLDAAKITAIRSRGLSPDDAKFLKQEFAAQGITDAHVDVWVNSDNLLVKKREQMQTATAERTASVYYSDYGVTVDLSTPPASDTFVLTSVTGKKSGAA